MRSLLEENDLCNLVDLKIEVQEAKQEKVCHDWWCVSQPGKEECDTYAMCLPALI